MQRTNFLAASVVGVVASLGGAAVAAAQIATPPTEPLQGRSNQNIRESYGRVVELIDELGLDDHDYRGHRVAAIFALNAAKGQLLEALRVRRQLERNQGNSNASIAYAQRAVARTIEMLQRDDADYAGHRVNAITDLQTAASDLQQALTSR